jgi:hypothetical protein
LIGDYAQNLELPHFGAEQPQDIYYFSALTVNVFGLADVTRAPTTMHAYGYSEDRGGKGGNNVASLLLKGLHDLGWIHDGTTGKQLSIILDNCGGQNKNNYVLRLALWLVERSYFHKVDIIFYIRGHTKNACDRLFNQLKKRYHRQQIFTMGQLSDVLNSSPNVHFQEVQADDFFDYGDMLDHFYKKFPNGTIQNNHVFSVSSEEPTKMIVKTSDDADPVVMDLKLSTKVHNNDRATELENYILTPIQPPGLKEIKQVELYSKFRRFVPEEFKDIICPKPSDEILSNIKQARSDKTRLRNSNKKRAASRTGRG